MSTGVDAELGLCGVRHGKLASPVGDSRWHHRDLLFDLRCVALSHGDSIINIGSMSSERFSAGAVAYTASKTGITGVTGVLAVELASRGIRVNQINPGAVDTEGARAIGAVSDEARAAHIARAPLGRVGTPADIASVAVFLASGEAGWLTGECLAVSGGLR
jgi:3-oxoacyl-[acyl-carrier protein] reductase